MSGLHDRTVGVRNIQRSIDSSPSGVACLYVTLSRRAVQAGFAGMQFQTVLGTISFIMLASEKLHRDLEFISRHDGLTQCLNKQSAIEELQREVSRAKRHGNKLSILLIDLDKFKDINDTHGHLAGDKVLVDFAQKAKISLRDTDRLTRFGGDEFMAILPDTDLEQALLVASRLNEAGKASQPIAWSVSIGASAWLDREIPCRLC